MLINRLQKFKKIILIGGLALLSLMNMGLANAAAYDNDDSQSRLEDILKTVGKGWQLKSNGGLLYIHPEDKRFWVSLSGVMRFDQTFFSGTFRDKRDEFPNGGNLRKAEVDIVGGIGQDWNYTIGLEFGNGRSGTQFGFSDSWLAYSGFCDNIELFIGRHSANWFGLENSTSTSWYPFLERSVQANAFYPGDGLGLLVDAWWNDGGFTALALQPDHGPRTNGSGRLINSDRWLYLSAITFAPIHEIGNVWHFGLSLSYRNNEITNDNDVLPDVSFASRPSARARNTAYSVDTGRLQKLNRIAQFNVEVARQCGPLLLQAEYSQAYVNRLSPSQGSLLFNGGSLIGQYMLTGEVHSYDVRDGNFGGIEVCSPYGAFEVAARYDFVNLNDKDIRGGTEHDVTLGLNWYANNNVRVAFNYVNANIRSPNESLRRRLDIFAARLQVKFK